MDRAYEKEYKEQFRNMTPEQIEFHIGLEKVRNVMEGFPKNHGIENIRKLIKEVQEEKEKRQCTDCKVSRDLDKFNNENRTCNSCLERSKRKREKNPEKEKERYRRYVENNRERVRETKKEYRKIYDQLEEECEICKCTYKKHYRSKHMKTKIHLANLEKLEAKNN